MRTVHLPTIHVWWPPLGVTTGGGRYTTPQDTYPSGIPTPWDTYLLGYPPLSLPRIPTLSGILTLSGIPTSLYTYPLGIPPSSGRDLGPEIFTPPGKDLEPEIPTPRRDLGPEIPTDPHIDLMTNRPL